MHYSAKRGIAVRCCLFVCDIGGSWPHGLSDCASCGNLCNSTAFLSLSACTVYWYWLCA